MSTVEVDEEGRITIPKSERERLALKPGDKLVLYEKDGELRLRRKISPEQFIEQLKGCIKDKEREKTDPLSIKKIWEGKIDVHD